MPVFSFTVLGRTPQWNTLVENRSEMQAPLKKCVPIQSCTSYEVTLWNSNLISSIHSISKAHWGGREGVQNDKDEYARYACIETHHSEMLESSTVWKSPLVVLFMYWLHISTQRYFKNYYLLFFWKHQISIYSRLWNKNVVILFCKHTSNISFESL